MAVTTNSTEQDIACANAHVKSFCVVDAIIFSAPKDIVSTQAAPLDWGRYECN